MSKSEIYIGVPNGVVLCVDQMPHNGALRARLFHGYHDGPIEIASYLEMLEVMERLFDELHFPWPGVKDRSFMDEDQKAGTAGRKEKERIMSDKEMLTQRGDLGTFIIRVQQRQGATWQGRVTWADQNKTIHFRSALELIKLIESGIEAGHPELVEEESPNWDE